MRIRLLALRHLGTVLSYSVFSFFDEPFPFVEKILLRFPSATSSRLQQILSRYQMRFRVKETELERDLRRTRRRLCDVLERDIQEIGDFHPAESIRVLYLLNNASPYTRSGYTVRTDEMISSLAGKMDGYFRATRLGYPSIVGRCPKNRPHDLLLTIPFWFSRSEAKRFETTVDQLVTFCKQKDITLLHATTGFENAQIAAEVARRLKIPWVYEMRGEPYNTWLSRFEGAERKTARESEIYNRWAQKELEAARSAAGVVTLSEITRAELVERGCAEDLVIRVPNAIDRAYLEYREKNEGRHSQTCGGKFRIGCISSLVDYEGIDDAIRSMKFLPENVELVVVGSGAQEGALKELRDSVGEAERIQFVGHRNKNEMPYWYSSLDVLLVPRKDTEVTRRVTPIKPLPALALGVPVVASDLPALREVTGGFAKFVQAEDPASIARGVCEVLENRSMYLPSEEWVNIRTWEAQSATLIGLYRRLLGQRT